MNKPMFTKSFTISIHALCEEGDPTISGQDKALGLFLSTPSARRATYEISSCGVVSRFLSTPSARRATQTGQLRVLGLDISIHALCEEGDFATSVRVFSFSKVLSTPSARRATAKTETKSLFSNKLYNILHEFRRALIYNGSKSYPNHAK